MSVADVLQTLEFLSRVVTKGHDETEALIALVARLEAAVGLVPSV
jgi:hypothetical protein